MKKILFTPILLLVLFSCSPDEETQAPTNTVQYTLSTTAGEGGSVTDGGTFDDGTEVIITASPIEGYRFTGWEGNSSTNESLTVTLSSNQTYEALFELTPIYTLTVTSAEGGTVSDVGGEYEDGAEVTIIATPNEGYKFNGWQDFDSDESSITITIISNQEYEALFDYEYNQLNLNEPPFDGTIYITGDIITSSDPSLFSEIEYRGTGLRQMYDRRNGGAWINIEPYLFDTSFSDGLKTEIQINPEFKLDEATVEANKYAFLIGQLPTALRKDVQTMWIHKGEEAYGGGNYNLLVHTGMTEYYENFDTGIVEETLIHEAAHTSLDAYHYPDRETNGENWIEAVENDSGCYISNYARDNQYREDIAELMPLYVAVRYFPERISSELRDKVLSCNINRIRYLDSQNLDMSIYED